MFRNSGQIQFVGSNDPNSAVCPSPPRCLLAGTDRRRGSDRCSALRLVISATLCEARPSAWKIERTGEWFLPLPPNHPIAATGLLRAHCHLKCAAGTPLNRSYVTIMIVHPLPARSSLRQLYLRLPTCMILPHACRMGHRRGLFLQSCTTSTNLLHFAMVSDVVAYYRLPCALNTAHAPLPLERAVRAGRRGCASTRSCRTASCPRPTLPPPHPNVCPHSP